LCDALQFSPREPFALEVNPSMLASVASLSAGCALVPSLFGIPDLRRMEAAVAAPLPWGGAGGLIRRSGNDLYRELWITLGWGVALTHRAEAGASVTAYGLSIAGYGHAWSIGINAGFHVSFGTGVGLGATVRNLNRPVLGQSREPVGTEILAGVQYAPVPSCRLMAGVAKEERSEEAGAAGVEIDFPGMLTLRAGTDGLGYGLGAGLQVSGVRLDYALSSHMELGVTHHFSVVVELHAP
jgi:hypothetical protein